MATDGVEKTNKKAYFNNEKYAAQIQKGEVYTNTQVPYDLVNSIPELSIPMRRLASMFANGVFMLESEDGTKKIPLPKDLQKRFKKPNPSQTQNEWLKQYLMQLQAYGNQYIYLNRGSVISTPNSMVNMNPSFMKPVLTGKMFKQVDINGIIEKYIYCEYTTEETIKTNDIIWNRIGDLNSSVVGKSLISSLQFPLSNTELAYKYLNVISGEKGALGILSNKTQNAMGAIPLNDTEKKNIENTYAEKYGIEDGQRKIIVTNSALDWTQIGYETKKLLLLEQIDANFKTILNALGCNQNLFINSTYENLKHGLVSTHNDTIVPYADQLTQSLTEAKIGVPEGFRLILDYSHLPYLQADQKQTSETFETMSNGLNTLVSSGIITTQEANTRLINQFPK